MKPKEAKHKLHYGKLKNMKDLVITTRSKFMPDYGEMDVKHILGRS